MLEFNRRKFLMAMLLAASLVSAPAFAKDGDSSGGGGGSGSGSGGGGSDNSGSGSDSDDSDDNDDGDDDDDDDDDEGENNNSSSKKDDQSRALQAVQDGKAVSLRKLKSFLSQNYPGKLLKVSLETKSGKYIYRVRILSKGNRIKTFSLNALTLKPGTI